MLLGTVIISKNYIRRQTNNNFLCCYWVRYKYNNLRSGHYFGACWIAKGWCLPATNPTSDDKQFKPFYRANGDSYYTNEDRASNSLTTDISACTQQSCWRMWPSDILLDSRSLFVHALPSVCQLKHKKEFSRFTSFLRPQLFSWTLQFLRCYYFDYYVDICTQIRQQKRCSVNLSQIKLGKFTGIVQRFFHPEQIDVILNFVSELPSVDVIVEQVDVIAVNQRSAVRHFTELGRLSIVTGVWRDDVDLSGWRKLLLIFTDYRQIRHCLEFTWKGLKDACVRHGALHARVPDKPRTQIQTLTLDFTK